MPLLKGSSDDIVAANISELRHSGMPEKQAIAIALKKANKHRAKSKSIGAKVAKTDTLKPFGST